MPLPSTLFAGLTAVFQQTPNTVVLNLFCISYPFIKQDCQIYPQYTQSCSFIENTKLTNSHSLEWFRKIYIGCNLFFSNLPPGKWIYPRLRTTALIPCATDFVLQWNKTCELTCGKFFSAVHQQNRRSGFSSLQRKVWEAMVYSPMLSRSKLTYFENEKR